jgi:hypothetical protein
MVAAVIVLLLADLWVASPTPARPSATRPVASSGSVVQVLRALLPAGVITQESSQGADPQQAVPTVGRVVFDDGHGAAAITAGVIRLPLPVPTALSTCPYRSQRPYDQCTQQLLANGSELVIDQSYLNPLQPHGLKLWSALLTYANGAQISLAQINAASPTSAAASRPTPPLTSRQLSTVATSNLWAPLISVTPSLPAPPAPPTTAELTRQQILTTLTHLLPAGLRIADAEGEKGYADLTVDDGHGIALLTVTVQQWTPGQPDLARLFARSTTQPDGTRLTTHQDPSKGRNTVEWEADALHAHNVRIVIAEVNTSALGLDATRPNPPLTLNQLAGIALNSIWTRP